MAKRSMYQRRSGSSSRQSRNSTGGLGQLSVLRDWIPLLGGGIAFILGVGGWWEDQNALKARVAQNEEQRVKMEERLSDRMDKMNSAISTSYVRRDLWDQQLNQITISIQQLRDEIHEQRRVPK